MYKNCIHRGYRLKDCRNAEISERKIIAALYRRIMDPEFGGVMFKRSAVSKLCFIVLRTWTRNHFFPVDSYGRDLCSNKSGLNLLLGRKMIDNSVKCYAKETTICNWRCLVFCVIGIRNECSCSNRRNWKQQNQELLWRKIWVDGEGWF